MSETTNQPYRLALFGLKDSGKTSFLTSGCLDIMHNDDELTCTREIPHQRPEGPEDSWNLDDPVVKLHKGYEWLNQSLERVKKLGEFPEASAGLEYLVRFSLTRPQRGKHEVEIMDYGGELHDFLEVNQDDRSEALRKKLMLNEGLIVLIETPKEHMDDRETQDYQNGLGKLRDGLQVLLGRHQKADRFPGPIAIVFSKWDRMWRPSDKITTQEAERERFNRFLISNSTLPYVKQIQQLLQQIDNLSPIPSKIFLVSSFGYLNQGKLNLERGLCSYFIANPLSWLTQEVDRYQVDALNMRLKRQGLHCFNEAELSGVELLKTRLQNQPSYQATLTLIDEANQKRQKREWTQYAILAMLILSVLGGVIFFKKTQNTNSIKNDIKGMISKVNSDLPDLERGLERLAQFCVNRPKEAQWCTAQKETLESMWRRVFEELRGQKKCKDLATAITRSKYRPELSEPRDQIISRCAQEGVEPELKATIDNPNSTFEEIEARLKILFELSKSTPLSETLQGYKDQLNKKWLGLYQHEVTSLSCGKLQRLASSHEQQKIFRPTTPQSIDQDAQTCTNTRYIKSRLEAYKTQQVSLDMMRTDLDWHNQNKINGPTASFEALNQTLSERWAELVDESKSKLKCSELNDLLADPKPISIQERADEEGKACETTKYIKSTFSKYKDNSVITIDMIQADQAWHNERCTTPLASTQEICAQFKATLNQQSEELIKSYQKNLRCDELKEALQRLQGPDSSRFSLCAYQALRDQASRDLGAAKIKGVTLLSTGELITEHHTLVDRWVKFHDKSRRHTQDPITITFTELKEEFQDGRGAIGECESDWTGCKVDVYIVTPNESRKVSLKISSQGNKIYQKFEVDPQSEAFEFSIKWVYDGYLNNRTDKLQCTKIPLSSFGVFSREEGNPIQCGTEDRVLFSAITESPYLEELPKL